MEDIVLKRAMFAMPLKSDTMNSGIMQGFEDGGEDDEYEEMSRAELTRRTPQSPEILMNNLRGDIRSVDARYEELAQMVGDEAAMDTPPEVLALLQGQMAQQQPQAAGIGALPQAPQMPPDMGAMMGGQPQQGMPPMPPEMMAQAPMPMDQGPMAMARGGIVQRFSDGSDEEGVTPATSESSSFPMLPGMFSPEVISQARTQLLNMASQQPMAVPTLRERVSERLPEYQEMLAPDASRTQAGLLFDIASAALGFGANVDPATGQPMQGSFASRLMQAGRTLPGRAAERLEELTKADRAIKLAAIQAGEKDIDTIRSLNLKLDERKRQALSDIVKSGANPFKAFSGMKDIDVITFMAPMYKDGSLDENGRRLFEARVTNYTQPQVMQFTDPVTGNISTREIRKQLPVFAAEALRMGGGKSATTVGPVAPSAVGGAEASGAPESEKKPTVKAQSRSTIWDLASDMTGPLPALGTSTILRPFTAGTEEGAKQQKARSFVEGSIRDLIKNLQNNPRYPEGERKAIENEIDIGTRFWDSPTALRNRLTGIDNFLAIRLEVANEGGYNESLPKETRQAYRTAANDITKFRDILMPRRVTTAEEVEELPSGTRFIWTDGTVRVRK